MANWTDLSSAFAYGTKLTSAQMQQLRDNITALAEGASGAPSIQYASASVDQNALGANCVGQSEIKETTASQEHDAAGANYTMTGGLYCYWPQIKVDNVNYVGEWTGPTDVIGLSYATLIRLIRQTDGYSTWAQWNYVTASGEAHWIWILVDKATGKKLAIQSAADHVAFGNRGAEHPFQAYDPTKHEIIVINPTLEDVKDIQMISALEHDNISIETPRNFIEIFKDEYDIIEALETDYPTDRISIALPQVYNGELVSDWRFKPRYDKNGRPLKIKPIKSVIHKPDYITALKYKRKVVA